MPFTLEKACKTINLFQLALYSLVRCVLAGCSFSGNFRIRSVSSFQNRSAYATEQGRVFLLPIPAVKNSTRTVNFGLDRSKRRPQTVVDGHQFESLNLFSGQYKGREMQGIQCAERFPKGNLASPLAYRRRQLPKLTARPYGADLAVRVGKPRFTDLAHLSQAVKCARRFD
jgi:hypothetical protein